MSLQIIDTICCVSLVVTIVSAALVFGFVASPIYVKLSDVRQGVADFPAISLIIIFFVSLCIFTAAWCMIDWIDTTEYVEIESIERVASVDEKNGAIISYHITTVDGAEYTSDSNNTTFGDPNKYLSDLIIYAKIETYSIPNNDGSERIKVTIYQ